MELLAHIRILMWQGASVWIVNARPAGERATKQTDSHAHHAIQLTIGLGGRFCITGESGMLEGGAVAVAHDVSHRFEAEGLIAIIFIEPESRAGRAVARKLFASASMARLADDHIAGLAQQMAQTYRAPVRDDAAMIALVNTSIGNITGGLTAPAPDLRIRKLIAWAEARLDQPLGLGEASELCGLSASRLRHLFVEQTGLQFRTYLLWLRLSRGVALLAAGQPLTQVAHEAGFSDSAHFTRTFRRMFGIAPTNLRIS